ncbi:MAG TPA: DJ-1/PfpI family protein [Baekduia sp.]|nr:DJ-1/PfpI family protein [Baekduia sp.]
MQIAFVLYPGFTALDLIGPYEVLSRWPGAEIHFVATTTEPVPTDQGLRMLPTDSPQSLPRPDVVVIPGAEDPLPVLEDEALIAWVRSAGETATWCASACTGAALYARAGLLTGRRATTHWAFREGLRAMGADVVADRVVFDEKFVTGAGVSAGIDMALSLTARVHGEELAKALQLAIEYDPQPPFDSGSPDKASASTLRLALRALLGDAPLRTVGAHARHTVASLARRARASA